MIFNFPIPVPVLRSR